MLELGTSKLHAISLIHRKKREPSVIREKLRLPQRGVTMDDILTTIGPTRSLPRYTLLTKACFLIAIIVWIMAAREYCGTSAQVQTPKVVKA